MEAKAGAWSRRLGALVAVLALAVTAVACGDDDDGGGASTNGDGNGGDVVAEAQEMVDELSGDQTFPELAPSAPPEEGTTVYIVSVDQSLEGIVRQVDGVEAAAEAAGWRTVLHDGQSSPDAMAAGVERAVADGADGIVLVSIDAGYIPGPVQEARDAGIAVVSTTAGSEVGPTSVNADIGSYDYNYAMGQLMGWYAIADSDGTAKALVFNDTSFTIAPPIAEGAVAELERCSGCEVVDEVDFTAADVLTNLSEMTRTALTRNPDVDYVMAPYDAAASFIVQGVRDAGRAGDVQVLSTGGNLPNLELIRTDDIQVQSVSQPLEYIGWLAIDAINRVLNDEDTIPFAAPMKNTVKENLPAEGEAWEGDEDFTVQFRELWGV